MSTTGPAADQPADAVPRGQAPTVRRQRVAAYVLCRRADAVLLSRLAPSTPRPGLWSLPGGGLDHGEHPRDGARREAHEETGLDVVLGRVLDVGSTHFTGTAPSGVLEDYHGVSVVYAGTTRDAREPRVLDVGGTSDAAAWVLLADVDSGAVAVTEVVQLALAADGAVGEDGGGPGSAGGAGGAGGGVG